MGGSYGIDKINSMDKTALDMLRMECAAFLGAVGGFSYDKVDKLADEVFFAYHNAGNPIHNYLNEDNIEYVREAISLNYPYIN